MKLDLVTFIRAWLLAGFWILLICGTILIFVDNEIPGLVLVLSGGFLWLSNICYSMMQRIRKLEEKNL